MKAYGEETSMHVGICKECKNEKVVRWHLTTEQQEVEVCDSCYLPKRKKGIHFDVGTTDFHHAVAVLEVAFGFEGQEWGNVKETNNMDELIRFLEEDGMDFKVFHLKEQ